jgi:hypothetical protein
VSCDNAPVEGGCSFSGLHGCASFFLFSIFSHIFFFFLASCSPVSAAPEENEQKLPFSQTILIIIIVVPCVVLLLVVVIVIVCVMYYKRRTKGNKDASKALNFEEIKAENAAAREVEEFFLIIYT